MSLVVILQLEPYPGADGSTDTVIADGVLAGEISDIDLTWHKRRSLVEDVVSGDIDGGVASLKRIVTQRNVKQRIGRDAVTFQCPHVVHGAGCCAFGKAVVYDVWTDVTPAC